jgi:hypothetical protein
MGILDVEREKKMTPIEGTNLGSSIPELEIVELDEYPGQYHFLVGGLPIIECPKPVLEALAATLVVFLGKIESFRESSG